MSFLCGLEFSCDDSCISFFNNNNVVFSKIYKQSFIHMKFKGVVPNVALHEHIHGLGILFDWVFYDKFLIQQVIYTKGPGLNGSLFVGIVFSKLLAFFLNVSTIGVSHIEGHILSIFISFKFFSFPYVALLISGGHTFLVYVRGFMKYVLLGCSIDDSIGEVFDKVASYLNFGYPGGPVIESLSVNNDFFFNFMLPHPFFYQYGFNFSFSGLKTCTRNFINFSKNTINEVNICASFQNNSVDILLFKTIMILKYTNVRTLVIVGGCSANYFLCKKFSFFLKSSNVSVLSPSLEFCTDNASMITLIGYYYLKWGKYMCDEQFCCAYPMLDICSV